MISSTVDQIKVRALISPQAAISVISPELASRIDKTSKHPAGSIVLKRRPIKIGIGRENFDVPALTVARAPLPEKVDFEMGRDAIEGYVFDVDLNGNHLRLVLKSEYRHYTRNRVRIPLMRQPGGRWSLPISIDGKPAVALLDLSQSHALSLPSPLTRLAETIDVSVGGLVLHQTDVAYGSNSEQPPLPVIGLRAFAGHHLTLDMPHHSLCLTVES